MTDHPDQNDDAFEQLARRAGAALRRPAPEDGASRLQAARRRQRIVRSSIAAGASAIIIVVGLVVVTRPSDDSVSPSGSSPTSTGLRATTIAPAPTTTAPAAAPLALNYTLTGIEGLEPIGEAQQTHVSSYTSMVAAWSTVAGVTDGYLVLAESYLPTWTVPVDGVTSVPIDVPEGRAYLVTRNGFESLTSGTQVMWLHTDGRLWTVSNFGLTPERLKALTLAIQPGSGLPYVLPDPSMTFIGFNIADAFQSVRQDWTVDEQFLEIGLETGGLVEQLVDAVPVSVVTRTIAGATGYEITQINGQVKITWPTGKTDQWAHLGVNEHLVDRIDELLAAITPR